MGRSVSRVENAGGFRLVKDRILKLKAGLEDLVKQKGSLGAIQP